MELLPILDKIFRSDGIFTEKTINRHIFGDRFTKQFSTEDARVKLKHLYPIFDS
jgi:hypothetical protein